MKKQTAMQRLREQTVDALKRHEKGLHDHEKGYKQCLNNLLNNIDLHLLEIEKEQIKHAYFIGGNQMQNNRYMGMHEYYNETYGGNK